MPVSEQMTSIILRQRYQQTYADVRGLTKHLPENALEALAREVISRLVVTTGDGSTDDAHTDEVELLSKALIGRRAEAAAELVEARFANGMPVEEIYLNYLGPASRMLGEWWEADEIGFAHVTVGTGRIYAIMRSLAPFVERAALVNNKAAMFASVPGETHTLGIRMASDLFRQEGWDIDLALDQSHADLVERIRTAPSFFVGLSAGGVHAVEALARLVVAARICRPDSVIIVSGNIVAEAEDTVRLMGIDGCAVDFDTAKSEFQRLWAAQPTGT